MIFCFRPFLKNITGGGILESGMGFPILGLLFFVLENVLDEIMSIRILISFSINDTATSPSCARSKPSLFRSAAAP